MASQAVPWWTGRISTAGNQSKFLYDYSSVQLWEKYCRNRRKLFWQTTEGLVGKRSAKRKTWCYSMISGANCTVILRNEHRDKQTAQLRWNCDLGGMVSVGDTHLWPLSPLAFGNADRGCPAHASEFLVWFYTQGTLLHALTLHNFPVIKSKGSCKSNQNFLHYATPSQPSFASIMRQPLINVTWCHSSCRVLASFIAQDRLLWEWKKGCLVEEAAVCNILGSEGGLHKTRRRVELIGKETRW